MTKRSEKKAKINQALDEIATACIALTQSEGYNTKENLQIVINHCKNYKIHKIQRVAIKSLDRVFVDILPSYTVDKHNAGDNPSKETQKRRAYESTLLECSRQFIQICEKVAFSGSSDQSCRDAAALALSDIHFSKPGFNTSKQLSNTIVKLACVNNERVREIACEKISEIFQGDPTGEATLILVSKIAVTPTTQISAELLQTLMSVKMKDFPQKTAAEKEKEKKDQITDKDLIKELREADIINERSNEEEERQIHILEQLFSILFQFLKETRSEPHFITAVDVIRKDVKWINKEFVAPIVSALKQNRFSLRAAMTAAHTADIICKSCEYTVDLRGFYTEVYARAYESLEDRDSLIEFLALFELISDSIDNKRTASFAKRLMIMALHAPVDILAMILVYMIKLMLHSPELTSLLDFEFEAEGDFNIYGSDPDFCNGPSAKFWEISELVNHHNKQIREIALELSRLTDSTAVQQAKIRYAKTKVEWNPQKTLEALDYSERIFDADTLTFAREPIPKTIKKFEFE